MKRPKNIASSINYKMNWIYRKKKMLYFGPQSIMTHVPTTTKKYIGQRHTSYFNLKPFGWQIINILLLIKFYICINRFGFVEKKYNIFIITFSVKQNKMFC